MPCVCLACVGGAFSPLPPQVCWKLRDRLMRNGFTNVIAITTARVPIVKAKDPRSGIECDVCLSNSLALHNTALLRTYAQLDPR